MSALSYVWPFLLRDKDGGHVILSATAENPMIHANLIFYSYWRSMFYIAGTGIFDFFAPVTLTVTR